MRFVFFLPLLSFQSQSHIFSSQITAGICIFPSLWLDSEALDFWIRVQVVSLHLLTSILIYVKQNSNRTTHWPREPQNLSTTKSSPTPLPFLTQAFRMSPPPHGPFTHFALRPTRTTAVLWRPPLLGPLALFPLRFLLLASSNSSFCCFEILYFVQTFILSTISLLNSPNNYP